MNKTLQNVTIIGSGTQGSMLAFRSAAFGRKVCIYDTAPEAIERAMSKILIWAEDWFEKGKLQGISVEQLMSAVRSSTELNDALKDADLVIENVPEILELKQSVWVEIDKIAPAKTLLTTNSSSLKSSDIGKDVKRKSKTFNVNFMTPTTDDMVEVMWNSETSEETKEMALAFLLAQENVPIVTEKEIKGFSLNRVWRAMKKECLKLWAQNYIKPEDLDRAFMLEWGTPHGPFGLMDKVGLDIVKQIELTYYAESGDPSDIPPKKLDEYIEKGWLGEKTGRGFYTYPNPAYLEENFLRGGKKSG